MPLKLYGLPRSLRLRKEKVIGHLFACRETSGAFFPLRYICCEAEDEEPQEVQVLFSVSKKKLHNAVDRNRAKRQMREAFRLNQHLLRGALKEQGRRVRIAFIWMAETAVESERVERAMKVVLGKLAESDKR